MDEGNVLLLHESPKCVRRQLLRPRHRAAPPPSLTIQRNSTIPAPKTIGQREIFFCSMAKKPPVLGPIDQNSTREMGETSNFLGRKQVSSRGKDHFLGFPKTIGHPPRISKKKRISTIYINVRLCLSPGLAHSRPDFLVAWAKAVLWGGERSKQKIVSLMSHLQHDTQLQPILYQRHMTTTHTLVFTFNHVHLRFIMMHSCAQTMVVWLGEANDGLEAKRFQEWDVGGDGGLAAP